MVIYRFFFFFFCLLPLASLSQDVRFSSLSVEEGMSQGNVWDIHEDRFGFIWIATEDGLNMYDGYSFRIFRNDPEDPSTIGNNNIHRIEEDSLGNLWLATRGGLNFYHREKNRFERFLYDSAVAGSISDDLIEGILIDSRGNLWVGTGHGLNLFQPEHKTFKHFFHDGNNPHSLASSYVRTIVEDSQKRIWVGTAGGLSLLNSDGETFTNFTHRSDDPSSLSSNNITCVMEDSRHMLWVGTFDKGLNRKDPAQDSFKRFVRDEANERSLRNNYVYNLAEDSKGTLWVATDYGLHRMDEDGEGFTRYIYDPEDSYSLRASTITCIFFDRNDRMWVGTRFGGANIYDKNKYRFIHYRHNSSDKYSLSHNLISCFKEDVNGNFWVATDGGSLNYFDRKLKRFSALLDKFTNNKVLAVEKDQGGGLWVGMWQGGLNHYDPVTGEVKAYQHDPANPKSLSDDHIFYILKDHTGAIWVATWANGLNRYNPETDDFTRFVHDPDNANSISSSGVAFLFEDSNGMLWIGTELGGADRYDPRTNTFTHYRHSRSEESLSNNFVSVVFEDSKKRIWIGTYGGLNLLDQQTNTFKRYYERDGLPNDAIMGIQEDSSGKLWISTNRGLSCFDPEKQRFKNYSQKNGLQGNQFTRWASARLSTGELLFGGTNGFTLFHPDSIRSNRSIPPVYLTDFKVSNKPVKVEDHGLLEKDITMADEIQLSYLDNIFSFEFAALNYFHAEENHYRYKMEGFQSEWVDAGVERKATYTNLSPGTYVFRVVASNNDGVWNQQGASVRIVITPPYWSTWWFRSLAVLIGLGSIASFFMIKMNVARRHKRELEEKVRISTAEIMDQKMALEAQAENMQALNDQLQGQTDFLQQINEELQCQREEADLARKEAERANQAKSIFLATMSHEIRTPMNGVLGMTSLLGETTLTAEQKEYADTIRASGEALLTVINDILDFSKIESGNLDLDNHDFDLRQRIEEVMDLFSAKAAEKGLDLVYEIDYRIPAQLVADSHRLRQILINLLGNAMKFTRQGEIYLGVELMRSSGNMLELAFHVRDTGIGIPEDKLSRLFKPFSQVDSSTTRQYGGTGLGLAISYRLVELMGGAITVQSHVGLGTAFSFTIQGEPSTKPIRQYIMTNMQAHQGKKVLVVDDNATNRMILKNQLEQWKLSTILASSGAEALSALELMCDYDLVITDMHMPEMDGIQLAQQIKAKYPKLPIILLSSAGDESKKKYIGVFSSILNKPVKQQQLFQVVQQAVKAEGSFRSPEEQGSKHLLSEDFATQYPLKILLAEDNTVNQLLAVRVLKKLGYAHVDVAMNGADAVEKLEKTFYNVILMDVQMPIMDGLEATRIIRSGNWRQPTIVAMTANAMASDKEICLQAGMDEYISKPINLEQLMSTLQKASAM